MSKKRRNIPVTRIKFNRCQGCKLKYHGVEKDKEGNILRIFDCKNTCYINRKEILI